MHAHSLAFCGGTNQPTLITLLPHKFLEALIFKFFFLLLCLIRFRGGKSICLDITFSKKDKQRHSLQLFVVEFDTCLV